MTQAELECRFRADGRVIFATAAYCDYFGWAEASLDQCAQPPHLAQGLEGWPQLNLITLTPSHPQINHESSIRTVTGEVLWQQWYNQGQFDAQGQLTEIRAVGRDITRYKLAELRLQQRVEREQALGNLVDRLRQSFSLDDIFAVATQDVRQLLGCDRASIYQFASNWSGYFVAESVANGWLPLVGSDTRTVWADTHLQETEGGRYRRGETFAVDDVYLGGHTPCHLDILEQFQVRGYAIVPVFSQAQGQTQLWGLLSAYQNSGPRRWQPEDMTLLLQVAHHLGVALYQINLLEQAQQARTAAERASRAKSEFLSHMSHGLCTPLNAIIGYAQYLLRDHTLSADTQSYLDTINTSGEHLLSLINTILSMAKIEAGQMTVTKTAFSLPDLVQRLIDMLLPRANAKGLTLTFTVDETVPSYIRSDQGKLQQIVLNLLDNALKFTETGRVSLAVQEVVQDPIQQDETAATLLRFTVSDTGPGIGNDQAQALFQPFGQAEAGRAIQEGTGLGLAISRQFAHLLGGDLTLERSSTEGSTFCLRLPVTPVHQVELKPRRPARRVVGLAADQPAARILVADDNEPSRRLLVTLLKTVGFEVQAATNGQEAVDQWRIGQPQLISMDLRMPVLDDYQATQQIKAVAAPPIILALTASAFDEEEQVALARWPHPTQGMISPQVFIPIAEESGLIGAIGEWVLRVTCAQLRQWQQQFPDIPLYGSVNVASQQIQRPGFIAMVDRALADTGLAPTCLHLEITERALIEDTVHSAEVLATLRQRHIFLSLDDFGTGYSSLSYLQRFSLDVLKIDKSFVQAIQPDNSQPEAMGIIRAILGLA